MKLLLWLPLVVAILQYHISVGAEQEVEENALIAFENEFKECIESGTVEKVVNVSLIIVASGTLIGLFAMYPILLLVTLIAAWIIASGFLFLFIMALDHGPRFLPFEDIPETVDSIVKSLVYSPILFIGGSLSVTSLMVTTPSCIIIANSNTPYLIEEAY